MDKQTARDSDSKVMRSYIKSFWLMKYKWKTKRFLLEKNIETNFILNRQKAQPLSLREVLPHRPMYSFLFKISIIIAFSKLYTTLFLQIIHKLVKIVKLGISYSYIFAMPGEGPAGCSVEPETKILLLTCWQLHECKRSDINRYIDHPRLRGLSLKYNPIILSICNRESSTCFS